jgi:hypothetical protein
MSVTEDPVRDHEESDSEVEEEEVAPKVVEVDPSKLTPLSPEVISKQVFGGCILLYLSLIDNVFVLGNDKLRCVKSLLRFDKQTSARAFFVDLTATT